MELDEAISKRRSVRQFLSREVPDSLLDQLLEAAVLAPSEGNVQAWQFYVVKNEKIKRRLAEAAYGQMFVAEAPVTIVVCIDSEATAPYGRRGKELYSIQSTAAAVENMLLKAVSVGLGCCWVGAFNEKEVAEILEVKTTVRPVIMIPVGYPAENPPPRGRKPLKDLIFFIE